MADVVLTFEIGIGKADLENRFHRVRRRWIKCLLVSSITAGTTGLFGLLLAAASFLHLIAPFELLSVLGSALLFLTFPLLVFTSHCLDRIDDANKGIRLAAYRENIFGNSDHEVRCRP